MSGSSDEDKESKTLDPTEHAIQKALKEGRTPLSQEISHLALLIAVLFNIYIILPMYTPSVSQSLAAFLGPLHLAPLDGSSLQHLFKVLIKNVAAPLFVVLGISVGMIWFLGLGQSYKAISGKLLMPKFSNLSIKKGWNKIFSVKALVEFSKTLVKATCLILVVLYMTKPIAWTQMLYWSIAHIKHALADWLISLIMTLFSLLACVVGVDIFYQRWQHKKDLRMSHKDMKDEQKEMEGQPEVKQKQRQMAQNRKRMIAAVPEATVVVMNPTHYAVALLWKEDEMEAPTVVAKGRDELALKIRDVARENRVPVVENPPLARALYDQVKLDKQIPPEHYQAVANIIRWVSELGKRTPI